MQQDIKELFTCSFFMMERANIYQIIVLLYMYTMFNSNIHKSNLSMSKVLKFDGKFRNDLKQKKEKKCNNNNN